MRCEDGVRFYSSTIKVGAWTELFKGKVVLRVIHTCEYYLRNIEVTLS